MRVNRYNFYSIVCYKAIGNIITAFLRVNTNVEVMNLETIQQDIFTVDIKPLFSLPVFKIFARFNIFLESFPAKFDVWNLFGRNTCKERSFVRC